VRKIISIVKWRKKRSDEEKAMREFSAFSSDESYGGD
jgi:hypothetical protein